MKSVAAVGKAQGRYVSILLGFMALLWGWHFMRPEGLALQFSGISIQPSGLWTIAPAFLTTVSLALIGTMNAMGPVWKRFSNQVSLLGLTIFWSDADTQEPHRLSCIPSNLARRTGWARTTAN